MRSMKIALAFLGAIFLTISAAIAFDEALLGQNDRALQQFRTELQRYAEQLRRPALSEEELSGTRDAIEAIRADAAMRSLTLAGPLAEVNEQIASLGEAPAAGASEDASMAKTRADLTALRDRVQSLKSQLDIVAVEAEQEAARATALQRDQFLERIFDRGRSILDPAFWVETATAFGVLLSGTSLIFTSWWSEVGDTGDPMGLLLVPLFVAIFAGGYHLINRWARRWSLRFAKGTRSIDDMARLWRIVRGLITTIIALIVLLVPISLAIDASGYFTPRTETLWTALTVTMGMTVLCYVLALRLAAPVEPDWRMVDLDDRSARSFAALAGLSVFVHYVIVEPALSALALLSLMCVILLVLKNQDGLPNKAGRKMLFRWVAPLTPFIWLLILVGFGALLTGYIALAHYIAEQLVRTSMLLGLLFVLYHLFDAAVTASFDPQSSFGIYFRRITGLGERSIERLGLAIRTAVDLLLIIAGIPLLILFWTLTWVDFAGFYNTLALGVKIGEITISPGIVLLMLAILAAGIVLTKLFNRWLERRILNDTRINRGVQDSILKGSTYLGYLIAGVLALTATGVDFSCLAIIAGALGIGIGLGLQSIVNNFVSGLIILAERPIRVGDWVSLPTGEGVVRRINVRSTEIETFDACSIILPNSLLVTEPVRNWTHNDNMGRFLVTVTVDSGCDAEEVRQVLLETAREHKRVLRTPEPTVLFSRFGAAGLDFELRAFVSDIFEAAVVASEIRFDLFRTFREKDIHFAAPAGVRQPLRPQDRHGF